MMNLDDLYCKISDCIENLDEIADELDFNFDIDSTKLNKISDMLCQYQMELRKIIDKAEGKEEEPDWYHIDLQEKLDKGEI